MTSTPEISIIVPVYNIEKYLRQCLDSIERQNFSDWECILVDDGSSDSSGKICDEYASRDSRFCVFHERHKGVAVSRNIGLDACRGQYIGFVDSDDIIYPDMFQRLHTLIVEHDADVAQVSYEMLYPTEKKPKQLVESVEIYNQAKVIAELISEKRIPNYLCIKLFKRDIVNVRFPEGMLYEDVYFMTVCSRNIKKMVNAPDILYSYRQRKGSISKSFKNRIEYVRSILHRARLLRELASDSITAGRLNRYVWSGMIRAVKNIVRSEDKTEEKRDRINELSALARTAPAPELKCLGMKLWFRARMLIANPVILISIIRIHRKSHSQVLNLFD